MSTWIHRCELSIQNEVTQTIPLNSMKETWIQFRKKNDNKRKQMTRIKNEKQSKGVVDERIKSSSDIKEHKIRNPHIQNCC